MTHEFQYVLLADDDPDDRDFFCAAMKRVYPNVKIRAFEDGDHLLDYLNHCSKAMLPGCIVLDYKMPRLTAPQFLRATGAGTRYTQIPKIVWSTSHLQKDREECLSVGATSFHIKPNTDDQLDNLLRSLARWINTPVAESASAAGCGPSSNIEH